MATTRATKETLFLRRDFTPDERLEMGRDLAQAHNRVAAIDDEEKSMKATVKEKKTGVELTIGSLSRKLNDGYEMANVTCTLHWDSPNIGEVTYRDPLGNEVKTRAMTIEERQEELPFEESAANINNFLGNLDVTPEPEFDESGNGPTIVVPPEKSEENIAEFFGNQDATATDQPEPIEEAVAQEPALPETFESKVRESMGVPEPFPATLSEQLEQADKKPTDESIWQAALKTLKNHPNIVPLLEVFYKPKEQTLKIVFDYYEQDLKKFITSKDYKPDEERVKVIIKKIINGVAYIHSRRVLHRDLKPQNILVDSAGTLSSTQKT